MANKKSGVLGKKTLNARELKSSSLNFLPILKRLSVKYKEARCALDHESPFQLLIATILSAQCTDERVNKVTPTLFNEFPTSQKMSKASLLKVEKLIHSTGFYKNKAYNIVECAKSIVSSHSGEVPKDIKSLVGLRGVGRKTANVVLGNAFGIPSGIVVDTHVLRLSNRMGFIKTQNPEIAEKKLMLIVSENDWIAFPHWMIHHGRLICMARSPKCKDCFIQDLCPKHGV